MLAIVATLLFGEFAETVMAGKTQAFDDAVLRWMGAHHTKLLDNVMLEITALGTGSSVMMMVCVAAMFLALTRHRYSALLLLVATTGGIALNNVLKIFFDRPRPHVIVWVTHANSSSFPSGHAMTATVVYCTVAYLAARLQRRTWARWLTLFLAGIVIALISVSRVYLGVHYPSDVAAGAIVGVAWAAFCMATLEAIQRYSRRSAPELQPDEKPAPELSDI
jgi:undecaprenyl-diphosphatase